MPELETDWSTEGIVARRDRYYAASQRAFVPYKTPLIFSAARASTCGTKRASAISTCWA